MSFFLCQLLVPHRRRQTLEQPLNLELQWNGDTSTAVRASASPMMGWITRTKAIDHTGKHGMRDMIPECAAVST
jgi:hypothetical protein